MRLALICIILGLALLMCSRARAHDDNPAFDQWYSELRTPSGFPCCNQTDCKTTSWRAGQDGGIEAYIDQRFPGVTTPFWANVPLDAIQWTTPNPTGKAVACWYGQRVICFIPVGAGT